jgi:hypothetical protein
MVKCVLDILEEFEKPRLKVLDYLKRQEKNNG